MAMMMGELTDSTDKAQVFALSGCLVHWRLCQVSGALDYGDGK
jgi:hypothetical protein